MSKPLKENEKKIDVTTFGCRLNFYESEVIKQQAAKSDFEGELLIFNTCAVTQEAERQARQAIRRARRQKPHARIIVTGCAAQVNAQKFAAMEEVDIVLGNEEKLHAPFYQTSHFETVLEEKILVNDIMSVKDTALHLISGFEGKTRSFVQVQNGCDHRCTFCRIPYGRGNSRSVPVGDIVQQVRLLVQNGYKEVVLTGVDITSYGQNLPGKPTLGQVVKRLLALVPDLPRLRLSSLDPVEVDADVLSLIAIEPRFMPHIHLSLQAGDNMILKRMKRRHLREDVIALCQKLRSLRGNIAFGADIIAGFPTETEEMFQNSLSIIEECNLAYLHVFPFSPHPETPASRMPQVPGAIIKERASKLREVGERSLRRFLESQLGRQENILMETESVGHTETFAPTKIITNTGLTPGEIVTKTITSVESNTLIAS